MGSATRRANEGEVKIGILQLSVVGEDLIHEQGDRLVVVVSSD